VSVTPVCLSLHSPTYEVGIAIHCSTSGNCVSQVLSPFTGWDCLGLEDKTDDLLIHVEGKLGTCVLTKYCFQSVGEVFRNWEKPSTVRASSQYLHYDYKVMSQPSILSSCPYVVNICNIACQTLLSYRPSISTWGHLSWKGQLAPPIHHTAACHSVHIPSPANVSIVQHVNCYRGKKYYYVT
jgi:hypothetical protein